MMPIHFFLYFAPAILFWTSEFILASIEPRQGGCQISLVRLPNNDRHVICWFTCGTNAHQSAIFVQRLVANIEHGAHTHAKVTESHRIAPTLESNRYPFEEGDLSRKIP
jgi:hypothetical protein